MMWHIALAQPNKEGQAQAHLKRLRYEAQYPLMPAKRKFYGKMTNVYRPMFPGYIFVRLGANQGWYRLETAPGIRVSHSMLTQVGRYATVTEAEMSVIWAKAKALCEQVIEPEKTHEFDVGDEVLIKVGPFADFMATIEEIDDDARTALLRTYLFGRENLVRDVNIDHLSAA